MPKIAECNFAIAEPRYTRAMAEIRSEDLRSQLYRAIYRGDIDAAEDAINLLAMVDIDRDLIWQAKGMERG